MRIYSPQIISRWVCLVLFLTAPINFLLANSGSTFITAVSGGGNSGGPYNWDDTLTWNKSNGTSTFGYPDGASDTAQFEPIGNPATINVDGTFVVETLQFETVTGDNANWTIGSTGTLSSILTVTNSAATPATISANLGVGSQNGANATFNAATTTGSLIVSGDIIDSQLPASLTIASTGTVELDGTNTYSAGTALQSGILVVGNAAAAGTGALSVTGGELVFGNNNHTLALSNYSQSSGTLTLSVAGPGPAATADSLAIANSTPATLGGALDVNLGSFVRAGTGVLTFTLLSTTDGYTGTFTSDLIGLASGLTASIDYTADDVLLQINEGGSSFSVADLTPEQQGILAPINRELLAGSPSAALASIVAALGPLSATPSTFGAALEQLSPKEFGRFTGETAFNNASFETQAMDDYLAGQRSGPNGTFAGNNGPLDMSGLTLNDPNVDPGLQVIHSRMLAWSPASSSGAVSDIGGSVLGGLDMKDTKSMVAPMSTDPWNFFARGNLVLAQGFSDAGVGHFDDNTESVVLGTDYRIAPDFLVGVTAGYGHTDVTLDNAGSSATVDSYSPGLYASYADHGWYANLTGAYSHNAYTQNRVISFLGQTADSAPEGDEGTVNLDGGHDFHLGAFTLGPLAGLQYTHLTVDGYTESGSAADLHVNEQDADSLRSRLGGQVRYNFSDYGVTFRPHLDATWQHEFMDESRGISSQFNDFGGGSFNVRTAAPDRDFALADAGLEADLNRTVTLFTDYAVQTGQGNYFGQSVQAGCKIGF